jgi:hypothetical protein
MRDLATIIRINEQAGRADTKALLQRALVAFENNNIAELKRILEIIKSKL